MNKEKFQEVMSRWDYRPEPGLNFRSIYGNEVYKGDGMINKTEKFTVFTRKLYATTMNQVNEGMFMAVNDAGLWHVTKTILRSLFPEQSGYEKTSLSTIKVGTHCNENV